METFKLPTGKYKIMPFVVEDRKAVLEFTRSMKKMMEIREESKNLVEVFGASEVMLDKTLPIALQIIQRCIKRQRKECKGMNAQELDEQPDEDLSTLTIKDVFEITNEILTRGFGGVSGKKNLTTRKRKRKSSKASKAQSSS